MKKYLIWAIGAVALIALIIGASALYDKLSGEYQPEGGGIEELPPWGDGSWDPLPTEPDEGDTDPVAPSDTENEPIEPSQSETAPIDPPNSDTEPAEPSQSETEPISPSESETVPVEPSESETEASTPVESESQSIPTETTKPPQSTTEPPVESSDKESETPAPTETEAETPKEEEPPARPTLKAPDFSVLDMEGNVVKLSDYTDKPIVINFWATWCGYCDMEMPDFEKMYKKYGDRVNFLMVNAGDTSMRTIQNYISENGYTFPVFYDAFDEAASAYDAGGFPTTYFFYGNGTPGYRGVGMLSGETLEATILKILE